MPISSAGILAGLILPDLAAILRPVMEVFVVLLMTLAYSRLDWSGIRTISGKPLLTAMILLWVLAAVPGLSAAAGWALALPSVLLTAIILNAIAPPITSSVPFCQLLGLDAALALRVTLIATLLMPVTVPASILLLLGVTIDLDPGEFALRAAVFIGLPLVLSWLIRRSPRLTARLNRGTEVDVVLDLMIHDIDLVQFIAGSPIERIEAVGAAVITDKPDVANARIRFENGCIANVTASRTSLKVERKIRIFQEACYFSADLHQKSVSVYRKSDSASGPMGLPIAIEQLECDDGDALRLEIEAFLAAVRDGTRPLVTGEDGRQALQTATDIIAQVDEWTGTH